MRPRDAIILLLAEGPATYREIGAELNMDLVRVKKTISRLEKAEVVTRVGSVKGIRRPMTLWELCHATSD